MAYVFSGVFSDGDHAVMASLLEHHTGVGRTISRPFRGFGVAFVGEDDFGGPLLSQDLSLVEWSRRFPQATFVYLWVECFGGDCDQAGFVFRNGSVLHEEAISEGGQDDGPLQRLLRFLGIELVRGEFDPLNRGYFRKDAPEPLQ
jgi:hypothetical protein